MAGAAQVGALVVNISADTASFRADMAAASQAVDLSAKSIINSTLGITDATSTFNVSGRRLIETLREEVNTFGMSREQLTAYRANLLGVGDEAGKLLGRLQQMKDAQEAFNATTAQTANGVATSTAQTAFAMRQLPAQFSDIVVSLQGGQKPLTVLLQQGSQIKDMFGGIGPAIRATGEYVMGLINPFTLAAAAAAALAFAVHQGAEESDAFNRKMQLTGNYAGITQGQFNAMARDMTQASQTGIGTARDMLSQLTATGKFTGDTMKVVGKTALDFADMTADSAKEVVKDFEKMADGVADWAEKHNNQYHFLTAAQYQHITALEKEGQAQKAMQVTMEAFDEHAKKNVENIGFLERAWRATTAELSSYWDKLKGLGRDKTIDDQIAAAESRLASLQSRANAARGTAEASRLQPGIAQAQADLQILKNQKDLQDSDARDLALQQQLHAAAIQAVKDNQTIADSIKSRAQQGEDMVQRYLKNQKAIVAEGSLQADSAAQQVRTIAAIRAQYADKPVDDREAKLNLAIERERSAFEGEKTLYDERLKMLDLYHAKFGLSDADYYAGRETARAQYMAAAAASYDKESDLLANFGKKNAKEEAETQKRLDDTSAKYRKFLADMGALASQDAVTMMANEKKNLDDLVAGIDKAGESELKRLQSTLEAQKLHNAEIGKTKDQVALAKQAIEDATTAEMQRQADAIAVLLEKNQVITDQGPVEAAVDEQARTVYEAELTRLKNLIAVRKQLSSAIADESVLQANAQAAKQASEDWKKTADDIDRSLSKAIINGFNGTRGFIQDFLNTLKGLFARLVLQPVVQPLANFSASVLNPNAPQAMGGGSGNILGMANNASSLYKGYQNASNFIVGNYGTTAPVVTDGWVSAEGAAGYGSSGFGSYVPVIGGALSAYGASQKYGPVGGIAAGAGSVALGGGVAGMMSGAGFLSGAGGALAALGPWGWAALAAAAILGSLGGGETRYGAGYAVVDGKAKFMGGPSGGEIAGDQTRALIDSTYTSIQDTLKAIGSSSVLDFFNGGFESSGKGKGGVFAGGALNGVQFGDTDLTKIYNQSLSPEEAFKQFSIELQKSYIEALQAAKDVPKTIADQLAGVDVKALTADATAALVTSIQTQIANVKSFQSAVEQLPFENLKNLSFDAANGLIAAAGGLSALNQNLSSYYQNYYTEAERNAQTTKNLTAAFAELGYSLPTSRDQFRAIVSSVDTTTEAGQKLFNQLMGLQGALSGVLPPFEQATSQVTDQASAISDARNVLSDAYNRESSALKGTIDQFQNFAKSLRAFRDSLLVGDLSSLSLQDKFAEAQGQFDKTYALAKAGDPTAMGNLQSVAQTYLQQLQQVSVSKEDYDRGFARVQSAVENAANIADSQASIAQQQLDMLNQAVAGILDETKATISVREALDQYFGAGGTKDASGGGSGSVNPAGDALFSQVAAYGAENGPNAYYVIPGVNDYAEKLRAATDMANATGRSVDDVFQMTYGMSQAAWQDIETRFNAGTAVQARALGGYTPRGLTLVGEIGPELVDFDQPGYVHTASQTSALLDRLRGPGDNSEALLAEFRVLSDKVTSLIEVASKTEGHTRRQRDIFDAVVSGNATLSTESA